MQACKTGLSTFTNKTGNPVYAEKITAMELLEPAQKDHPGSTTLIFGESDKQAHLIGTWMAENKPEVGGYFVVKDTDCGNGKAIFVPAEVFEREIEGVK